MPNTTPPNDPNDASDRNSPRSSTAPPAPTPAAERARVAAEIDSPQRAPVPWFVHGLGLALAALFIFMLAPQDAPPPPPKAQANAEPASGATDAKDGKQPRRARARQRGQGGQGGDPGVGQAVAGGERNPVAVDSGFRRPLGAADDSELRPLYLTALIRVSDENILGGLQFNRSTYAPILKAGNATFDFGVAMHPPTTGQASATFRIPENARNFQATLALANAGSPSANQCDGSGGSVTFLVKTDENQAYKRIVVGPDGPHAQIQVELTPEMKTLTLITDSADGDSTCDGAVWAIARFMIEPPKTASTKAR